MGDSKINQFLLPQIAKLPKQKQDIDKAQSGARGQEFDGLLKNQIAQPTEAGPALEPVEAKDLPKELRISSHAAKRLKERNLDIDGQEFLKLKDALHKLKHKGGQDSLVVTNKAAYIMDVNNSTIVTAIDKNQMSENVFTKIDSTLFID